LGGVLPFNQIKNQERNSAMPEMEQDREQNRCVLRGYREEIINNGLNGLPTEIRDLALFELFGPESAKEALGE
jgi:hypothetical protein